MMDQKDKEIDLQKLSLDSRRKELDQRELNMIQEIDSKQKQLKDDIKAKYRQKMESYEQICSQNMHKKIEEVEYQLKDMHSKEIRSVSERIEHFYKTNYIEIKEHEAIV